MARNKRPAETAPSQPAARPSKLPRLPKNTRITKRPLLHPAIPSPYSSSAGNRPSQQKVIYISPASSFIGTVKRVRKLLSEIEKRALGPIDLVSGQGTDKAKLGRLKEKMVLAGQGGQKSGSSSARRGGNNKEEVLLKGTGRAIGKCLELGVFLEGQGDLDVRVRTGTVGTVDDIEAVSGGEEEEEELLEEFAAEEAMDLTRKDPKKDGESIGTSVPTTEIPESRKRMLPSVEIRVSLN